MAVVHFNMIVEINELLKSKGIEYSIHAVGGCTCAGLKLRQDGAYYDENKIVAIINEYLASQWMKVVLSNENILNIESKFGYEK